MTEDTKSPPDDTPPTAAPPRPPRRRLRRRWLLLSGIPIAAVDLFAARAFAHGGHHCRHGHGATTEEAMREHMVGRLDYLLDRVDADDAQRAEVERIVARRTPALFETRKQGRALRGELVTALRSGDRDRLQTLRARGVSLFDEATALGLDTAQEIGDVLRPEQRAQVLEHFDRFMH